MGDSKKANNKENTHAKDQRSSASQIPGGTVHPPDRHPGPSVTFAVSESISRFEGRLQASLFPEQSSSSKGRSNAKLHPDWNQVHAELSKKGMTRLLLWQEYKEAHPDGYGYTQFKEYYRRYARTLNPSMRQIHCAGDTLFVDFSGLTMSLVDPVNGEVSKAQIFVAVLGASGYTFVHAVQDQSTQSFIDCHNAAFRFYGGVPNRVVPDNLKAAVISHRRDKVVLNESYADMGRHYGVALTPARPYHPQDKGKVEAGVKGIQRWILRKLRHRTFFDIDELNEAIAPLIDGYNHKVIRRLNKSRSQLFEELDRPALHPLRSEPYRYREHKRLTIGIDYHIEVGGNGYSVPYMFLGKKVDVWYSHHQVESSHRGEVLAVHPRLHHPREDSTLVEHMPPEHRYQYEKWNPKRILNWAGSIGEEVTALMQEIMQSRSHPARGYKSCLAILNFEKRYGKEALELTAKRARELGVHNVASIETILRKKTYRNEEEESPANNSLFNTHANLRGSEAYR